MTSLILFSFLSLAQDYKHFSESCSACRELDQLVSVYSATTKPDDQLDVAFKVADAIKKMSIKGKKEVDQKREIYYAINSTIEVITTDFDSETCYGLLLLRAQAPKNFDAVFWTFPKQQQKKLADRMRAFKTDKILPNAQIPVVKELE